MVRGMMSYRDWELKLRQYREGTEAVMATIRALLPVPHSVSTAADALAVLQRAQVAMLQVTALEFLMDRCLDLVEEVTGQLVPKQDDQRARPIVELMDRISAARRAAFDVANAAIGAASSVITAATVRQLVQRGDLRFALPRGSMLRIDELFREATATGEAQVVLEVCKAVFEIVSEVNTAWSRITYLPDQRLYELDGRVYRVGKLIRRLHEIDQEVRFEPVVALLEAVTEVEPMTPRGIEFRLYVGAASGAAYREATQAGIRSCMAPPSGQFALMSSNMGLDDINGVLLLTYNGRVVARCKTAYVVCLRCGRTFLHVDRPYIADTRLTSMVWEALERLDAPVHKLIRCPACGYTAAAKVLRKSTIPHEDTFESVHAREATGLLVLPSSPDGWREDDLGPEDVISQLLGRVRLADTVCRQLDSVCVMRSEDVADVLEAIVRDAQEGGIQAADVPAVDEGAFGGA